MAGLSSVASGATTPVPTAIPDGVLNSIQNSYQPVQGQWHAVIMPFAYSLFWKLVLLDVGWSSVKWVLERKPFEDLVSWLVTKAVTVGFFFTLMKLSDTWIPAIIDSFAFFGMKASGLYGTANANPDTILNYGVDLAVNMITLLGKLGVENKILLALPICFFALLVFAAFCVVAGQLLVTLIESYIVIGAGVIMLGFSGSKWTTDMATSYLKYAVGTGIKIMLAYLIVGAGLMVFKDMYIDVDHLLRSCAKVGAQSLIFVFLAWNIPSLASAMLSGSPSATLGGLIGTATTATAAAVGTAVAAGQMAKSGASTAMDVIGSTSSRMAAFPSSNVISNSNLGEKQEVPVGGLFDSPAANSAPAGNANGASISEGEKKAEKNVAKTFDDFAMRNQKNSTAGSTLSEKIRNLNSYVPQDQANIQVQGINLSHGKE